MDSEATERTASVIERTTEMESVHALGRPHAGDRNAFRAARRGSCMSDDADISIDEKRVYADRTGKVRVFVATGMGVATVDVSDDLVGGFSLVERCDARDVTPVGSEVAVATAEDVLLGGGEDEFAGTNFGPAVAVGGASAFETADASLLAAGPSGEIARREDGEWIEVDRVSTTIHAISGDLVATDTGVYQVGETGLRSVGLSEVRDVAAAGVPHAATASGLYKLGNGWMDVLEGDFRTVAIDPRTTDAGTGAGADAVGIGRAHAATADALYEHDPARGVWEARDLPVEESVVDVTYGPATYAITDAGTLLVDAGDGWRHQPVGLRDPHALAVPAAAENA